MGAYTGPRECVRRCAVLDHPAGGSLRGVDRRSGMRTRATSAVMTRAAHFGRQPEHGGDSVSTGARRGVRGDGGRPHGVGELLADACPERL